MVEILVTVAILGLLIVVFLLWLRPDDDRRCRLEAQRLAAYLISAEANAIMRDGPVRVAFSFADNTGKREVRRVGASIDEQGWSPDKKADIHRIGSPVKLDTVETPLAGVVKGGSAWLNFNGARTPGGVAVLVLNEAIYSVLVPPQGQGEVKVAKGRVSMKDPKAFNFASPGSLPELALDPVGGGAGLGALPNLPIDTPPPNAPNTGAPTDDVEDPPVQDDIDDPPNPNPTQEPSNQPPFEEPEAQPEEEPEEDPDAECNAHADCVATMGERGVCVGGPNGQPNAQEPSENRCRANLEGLGYRVRRAQVTKPDNFAALLNPILNSYIANGHLNLVVFLQSNIGWEPSNDGYRARYLSWSFNANSGTSTVVGPHPEFPTARADSVAVASCGQPYTSCHDIISQEQTAEGDAQKLELWLPRVGGSQNECDFQLLEVVGTLNVSVNTVAGNSGSPAYVRLSGIITGSAARKLDIQIPGQDLQSLKRLFENNNIPPTYDNNNDGVADSWEIAFEGPAVPVGVTGNLEGARSNNPCENFD